MKIKFTQKLWGYLKPDYKPSDALLKSFGETGVRDVKLNFTTSGRNINNTWKPLEKSTKAQRRKSSDKDKPLMDTTLLFGSISKWVRSGSSLITTNRIGEHGENVAYDMNYGVKRRHVPAREFMLFSQDAIEEMIYHQKKEAESGS